MITVVHNDAFRIILFSCVIIKCLLPAYATQDSSEDAHEVQTGGIFSIMSELSKGEMDANEAFGNHGMDSAEIESAKGASGLTASTIPKGHIILGKLTIIPQNETSTQEHSDYKEILEKARRSIVPQYYQAVDATQRTSYFYGDLKLKIFLNDTGAVTSCIIDDYSIRDQSIREVTQRKVSELNFKPVHTDKAIKGLIVMFSFFPPARTE